MIPIKTLVKRVRSVMDGSLSVGPLILELYPTRRCNLNCVYCDIPQRPSLLELDAKEMDALVTEACEHGAKEIRLLGEGEPLIRKKECLSLIETIKQYKVWGVLITNGTLFSLEDIKQLVALGWDEVVFSLDSDDAEVQDYIRGKRGVYKQVVSAMEQFKQVKNELNADKPHIKINCVISKLNYRDLMGLTKLAYSLGVDEIYFDSLVVYQPWMKRLKLGEREQQELQKELPKLLCGLQNCNIDSNLQYFIRSSEFSRDALTTKLNTNTTTCYRPWFCMVVQPDGTLRPCCNFSGTVASVKGKTLMGVWVGKEFQALRGDVLKGKQFKCSGFCTPPMRALNLAIANELENENQA